MHCTLGDLLEYAESARRAEHKVHYPLPEHAQLRVTDQTSVVYVLFWV